MDALQELFDLVDRELREDTPPLQAAPTPFMGTPMMQDNEHPVTQQRRAVDMLRKQGMPPEMAHQQVYGDIDLSDTQAKRDMASTFASVRSHITPFRKGLAYSFTLVGAIPHLMGQLVQEA